MSDGRHVTAEECRQLRTWRNKGYTMDVIINVLSDKPLSKGTIWYHARGRCLHGGEPAAKQDGNGQTDVPELNTGANYNG